MMGFHLFFVYCLILHCLTLKHQKCHRQNLNNVLFDRKSLTINVIIVNTDSGTEIVFLNRLSVVIQHITNIETVKESANLHWLCKHN